MKKILLIFLVFAAMLSGCEKYTLNKIYGFYTLDSYTVAGVDSLSLYKDSLGTDYHFFYNDAYYLNICEITGCRTDGNNVPVIFRWELRDNSKKMLITASSGAIGNGPIGRDKTQSWDILKLTKKEMKLKTSYNNKEYELSLSNK